MKMETSWLKMFRLSLLPVLLLILLAPASAAADQPQCPGPKWGSDSVKAVTSYSLYRENIGQNILDAQTYKNWSYLFRNAPKAGLIIYVDGEKLLEQKIQNAESEAIKAAYVDTLMLLYDKRLACFGDPGIVLGKKGVDLLKYRPDAYQDVYDLLSESIEAAGNNALVTVPYSYMYASAKMLKAEKIDLAKFLGNYETVNAIIEYNLENDQKYRNNWVTVQNAIEKLVAPFVPCEELVAFYQEKYDAAGGELETEQLEKISGLLTNKGCTDAAFYLTVSKQLFEADPTAEAAFAIARGEHAAGNTAEALSFYKQAVKLAESGELEAEAHYHMARIYRDRNDCGSALAQAKMAVGNSAFAGRANLLMGDIVVTCAKQCSDDKLPAAPYWVAVDYYERARSADPAVAEDALVRIRTYSKQFPTREELFFHNLKAGDPYTIDCWFTAETTVREAQ